MKAEQERGQRSQERKRGYRGDVVGEGIEEMEGETGS